MTFFFTWLVFNNLFLLHVAIENPIMTCALAIPTSTLIIVTTDAMELMLFVTEKTIIDLSKQ